MDRTFYESLITNRNSSKPKYMAWVRKLLEMGVAWGAAAESTKLAFDLDNAAGNQLDIIGELVGLERLLPFALTTGSRIMNDAEYRLMLKMKIARNHWDGTNGDANRIYKILFGDDVRITYVDNQDMSVEIKVSGASTTREIELLNATQNILLPLGVGRMVVMGGATTSFNLYTGLKVTGVAIYDTAVIYTS